ncbi:MAG: hypothetical protein K0R52_1326 [Alphaproteobacteria bacterium]|jgi:hypothetical protein|nr:hypothetical protein [Alphaproteobacteria bacterium]
MRLINFYKFSVITISCCLSTILSISSSEELEQKESGNYRLNLQPPVYSLENNVIIVPRPYIKFEQPLILEATLNEQKGEKAKKG